MRVICTLHGRHTEVAVSVVSDAATLAASETFGVRATWLALPILLRVEGLTRQLDATVIAEQLLEQRGVEDALALLFGPAIPAGAVVHVDVLPAHGPASAMVAGSESRSAAVTEAPALIPAITASERRETKAAQKPGFPNDVLDRGGSIRVL